MLRKARRCDGRAVEPGGDYGLSQSNTGGPSTGQVTKSRLPSALPVGVAPLKVKRAAIDWMSIGTTSSPSTISGGGTRSKLVDTICSTLRLDVDHDRDAARDLPVG